MRSHTEIKMAKLVVVLNSIEGVSGTILFNQESEGSSTTVTRELSSLKPRAYGFHVHALGDTTNGCMSAGPHYNPYGKEHGAPNDEHHHVGDLGNVEVIDYFQSYYGGIIFQLFPPHYALVIEKLILILPIYLSSGHELSKSTGNDGGRIACGTPTLVCVRSCPNLVLQLVGLLGLLLAVDSRSESTSLSDASYLEVIYSINNHYVAFSLGAVDAEQIHSFGVLDEWYSRNLEITPYFEIIVISLSMIHSPPTCFLVNFASIRRGYMAFGMRTLGSYASSRFVMVCITLESSCEAKPPTSLYPKSCFNGRSRGLQRDIRAKKKGLQPQGVASVPDNRSSSSNSVLGRKARKPKAMIYTCSLPEVDVEKRALMQGKENRHLAEALGGEGVSLLVYPRLIGNGKPGECYQLPLLPLAPTTLSVEGYPVDLRKGVASLRSPPFRSPQLLNPILNVQLGIHKFTSLSSSNKIVMLVVAVPFPQASSSLNLKEEGVFANSVAMLLENSFVLECPNEPVGKVLTIFTHDMRLSTSLVFELECQAEECNCLIALSDLYVKSISYSHNGNNVSLWGCEEYLKALSNHHTDSNPTAHDMTTDVPAYPPPTPTAQTPLSPEWSSSSLPVSPTPSIIPSPISSPMIPLTVPSPVASPATAETEGFLTDLEHEQERVAVTFGAIWRPVLALESWAGQTDAQRAALWHAISDTQRENQELRFQIVEERHAWLNLAEIVDSRRIGQEPKRDV
ncbi:superoxide dismutase [Cu-Zn] [Tanacetum coccineum]